MNYTIISSNDNNYIVQMTINNVIYTSAFVCSEAELPATIAFYQNIIQNPPKPLQ